MLPKPADDPDEVGLNRYMVVNRVDVAGVRLTVRREPKVL